MTNKSKSLGGKARAKALTSEQRKAIAKKGAKAREDNKNLPIATHIGVLNIGETVLDVSVLSDGRRIISQSSVFKALDRPNRGMRSKLEVSNEVMPAFMDAKNLTPFISEELRELTTRVKYRNKNKQIQEGYEASILPLVCDLYLKARDANALLKSQTETTFKAEILVRSLARVGIIALVDEATGYQKDRAKNALAEILEKFVAKELQPWVKTFPTEYYEQLFRVWGQKFPPDNLNKRPGFMGNVTNNVIYSRLAPNLLEELKKAETRSEKKARLHQFLTDDIGHPKLREHLSSIITLLKISKDKSQFLNLVDQVHPKYNETYQLDFIEDQQD